jgi:PII-like signaling protein
MVEIKIFLDEGDRHGDSLMYEYIMRYLMHHEIQGACILPVFAGFGSKHHLHLPKAWGSVDEVPLVLLFIDEDDKIKKVLPHIKEIIKKGLIVRTNVELL